VDFIGANGDGGGGNNWSAKLQSKMSPPTPSFFYKPDALSCRPTNSVKALKAQKTTLFSVIPKMRVNSSYI